MLDTERGLLAHELVSQVDLHRAFGGVVPELASRDHVRALLPLVGRALEHAGTRPVELSGMAYTAGPGLIGALLTGAALARSLAYAWRVPAIGVHHLEGHLLARAPGARSAAVSARRTARLRRAHAARWRSAPSAGIACSVRHAMMPPARHSTRPQSSWVCRTRVARPWRALRSRADQGPSTSRAPCSIAPDSSSASPGSRLRCCTRYAGTR